MFFEMRFDLGTLDSGERSLPFGLFVWNAMLSATNDNSDRFNIGKCHLIM